MENKLILFAASTILTQFQRIFDFKFEEYAALRTIISIIPRSGINFVEKKEHVRDLTHARQLPHPQLFLGGSIA